MYPMKKHGRKLNIRKSFFRTKAHGCMLVNVSMDFDESSNSLTLACDDYASVFRGLKAVYGDDTVKTN